MRRRSFPRRPSHLGGSSSTCPEKEEQWFRREVTIPHEATPLKELQRLSTLPIRSLRNMVSCRVATDTANWQFTSGSTRSARVEGYIGIEPMTRWLTANCSTTELISQIGVELTPHLHSGCSLHNGSIGFIMVYIHSDKSTGTFAAVFSQDL